MTTINCDIPTIVGANVPMTTSAVVFNPPPSPVAVPNPVSHAEADYELARSNLHELLSKAELALDEMLLVANSSQHPRSYEVVAIMLKTISDINDRLLKLQKEKRDLDGQEPPKNITVEKGVFFTGTTDQLLKTIANTQVNN